MDRPPCKKCLLAEAGQADISAEIERLKAALPEGERASVPEYEKRLSRCRECESLSEGMCIKCGCFVELRAAKAKSCCPDVPAKW